MKIFKAEQVREADNYTIENEPVLSVNLMERAAETCFKKIIKLYSAKTDFKIFAGPGNNGGDGLVIARLLNEINKKVSVYIVQFSTNYSIDFTINLRRLEEKNQVPIKILTKIEDFPEINSNSIIIDSIFGSGLSRKVEGFAGEIITKINSLHNDVISVDIPSGLFGEENPKDITAINAAHTLTFESPFLSFFFAENYKYVGNFHIIPIGIHPDYAKNNPTQYYFVEKKDIKSVFRKSKKFDHKGTNGHLLIIAGSYGKAGAGILAAKAAHGSGVGLVTASVPKSNYKIMQTASPETMLYINKSKNFITEIPSLDTFSAIAIGPGIGFKKNTLELFKRIIEQTKVPLIIDADALTLLSENKELLNKLTENTILTPHVKEFDRIFGKSENGYERHLKQIEASKKYSIYIILKGAHTSITTPEGKCYFNSTGNAGMATAGSGDALTGITGAFAAKAYTCFESAIQAVFFHGLAGDFAKNKIGETALIASDIIENLGKAFKKIEK